MQTGDQFHPSELFAGPIVPKAVARLQSISPGAKLCYGVLVRLDSIRGECFPSVKTISEEIGVSARQVQRYLEELEKAKLMRRDGRKDSSGRQCSNRYVFLWHQCFESARVGGGRQTPLTGPSPIGLEVSSSSLTSLTSTEKEPEQKYGLPTGEYVKLPDKPKSDISDQDAVNEMFRRIVRNHPAGRNPQPNLAAQCFISRAYARNPDRPSVAAAEIERDHGRWRKAWESGREPKDLHNWLRDWEPGGDIGPPGNGQQQSGWESLTRKQQWEVIRQA